jgi:hypothetical protein
MAPCCAGRATSPALASVQNLTRGAQLTSAPITAEGPLLDDVSMTVVDPERSPASSAFGLARSRASQPVLIVWYDRFLHSYHQGQRRVPLCDSYWCAEADTRATS